MILIDPINNLDKDQVINNPNKISNRDLALSSIKAHIKIYILVKISTIIKILEKVKIN